MNLVGIAQSASLATVGRSIPQGPLQRLQEGGPCAIDVRELLRGRTAVLFGLPGAFTPTCSSQHLPRFEELADTFRAQGVDGLYCVAVNDAYVMAEWGRNQGVLQVELLADGNAAFSGALGMLADHRSEGLGWRSRRYSMLVRNGVIEVLLAEPDVAGDPYSVSDADTLLDHIAPNTPRPPRIALLTKPGCPYCAAAKRRLEAQNLRYREVALVDAVRTQVISAMTGESTAPQVFIDGRWIGGSEGLERYLADRSATSGA